MAFARIWTNPHLCGGVPCIRGLRIPVVTVVAMIAEGMTPDEVRAELPDLELEDVQEALGYAAGMVGESQLPPIGGS